MDAFKLMQDIITHPWMLVVCGATFTVLACLLSSLFNDVSSDFLRSWGRKIRLRHNDSRSNKAVPFQYDPRSDDLFVINRWSQSRLLTKDKLSTRVLQERPEQDWIDASVLENESSQMSTRHKGDICYITDFQIDHGESVLGSKFVMTVTPCDYSEHMAVSSLLKQKTAIYEKIKNCVSNDPREYTLKALPSSIAINVVVVSNKGNFLAIERSRTVDTAKGIWTVGPFETMTLPKFMTPGANEDLFGLAERCLREELGLEPNHYGEVFISWFGYYLPIVRGHVVAQIKLDISEGEALELAGQAHSIFESERFEWLPFNKKHIAQYINEKSGPLANKNWINQAPLALQETYRMRHLLF